MSSNSTCSRCGGSGSIIVERMTGADIYGVDKPLVFSEPCPDCNGGHDKKVIQVKKQANLPSSFYDAKMVDFKWNEYIKDNGEVLDLREQKKFIDSFVDNFEEWQKQGLGLYLWSNVRGSGKTFLASCVCNELMERYHMTTKFVSASNLIQLDQEAQKENFYKNPIEVLAECMLLVIDDLGQQKNGENWLDDILFRIIDARYQNKLVTIVTSNIPLRKLRLDDRVTDRLNKMVQPIPLPEISFRTKESNKDKREFFKRMGLMNTQAPNSPK